MPPSSVSPEQRRQAFDARLGGSTLREIAGQVGFSVEGARRLVEREAERQLVALHSALLLNGSVELVIPADQLQAVLAHAQWAVRELRSRGVRTRLFVVARGDGLVLGLEEDHAPEEGR